MTLPTSSARLRAQKKVLTGHPKRHTPHLGRRGRRAGIAAFAALLVFGGTAVGSQAAVAAPTPIGIDILTINDFHGRLEADGANAAGAAVVGGVVNQYRTANPNTTFVGAGDLIGASTFTSFIQHDEPTIDAFNAMHLDVSSVGNHEFDQGAADLFGRVLNRASWDYLAANVYRAGTKTPALPEYQVESFPNPADAMHPVRVGFIGAVTQELPSLVSPAGLVGLDVGDIAEATNRVADQLSDGNDANGEADVIVLLVHEGAATVDRAAMTDDSAFGRVVNGVDANVDAIVSGHTHLPYDFTLTTAKHTAPLTVLQAGDYGQKLGHIKLAVDPTRDMNGKYSTFTVSSELIDLTAGSHPSDPTVAGIVANAVSVANAQGSKKLGDITASFARAQQTDKSENRGGESTLGNFVADVQLWSGQDAGAQIAFMNPGGLRTDLAYLSSGAGDPAGNVTYREAASVQPFANTLVAMNLTGAQIRTVLEQQWQPSTAARPFLKLGISSGFAYTYDPAAPTGSHISTMTLNGKPVAPTDTFRVIVNSFLAAGGDNFVALAGGTQKADTGKVDLQGMVDYFAAKKTASPDDAQRAVGVHVSQPASPAGFATGEQVTLTLSSLLFSTDAPGATAEVVGDGGVVLGSAPIDPSIVDTTDEQGRATVSFLVPAGLATGTGNVTVRIAATGTSMVVPLALQGGAVGQGSAGGSAAGHSGTKLASTGLESSLALLVGGIAALMLVAGGILLGMRRGRRTAR
jgi:5'-nucleotidase